ncbi:putative disease resistance protein RGA3 [Carex littledalei]|uniref:Putative disease resistance protein RGA3 n=1 Tax=Carex littledalei TaxID=544730 RepID=A0A833R1M9_9POAL|nr:putative disease resistance protein RGA3 [Carex littledalei]
MDLTVAGWFIQVIFDKLLSYNLSRWAAARGLGHDMEKLRIALLHIQSILTDAERTHSAGVLKWMPELHDVAYEAEDLLDELEYWRLQQESEAGNSGPLQVMRDVASQASDFLSSRGDTPKKPGTLENSWDRSTKTTFKVLIDRLNQVASGVSGAINIARIEFELNRQHLVVRDANTSSLVQAKIFGRDIEVREMLNFLVRSNNVSKIEVIGVIGMGGIGKTMIAQHVYNDNEVLGYFDSRMWVCVRNQFDEIGITKELLEYVSDGIPECNCRPTNFNVLQTTLEKKIKSRRFLLVLDDVRDDKKRNKLIESERWERLLLPLKSGEEGSKVIVTSQSREVAQLMDANHIIKLEPLRNDDCWSIIKDLALDGANHDNTQFDSIGRKIAKKLKGLPLAAKVVARHLKDKKDVTEWGEILRRNNIWDEIMPILALGFHHLPVHLQRCFAYCSIFPKGWLFELEQIVHLWMAQGFIQQQSKRRMEDIGREYMNYLFQRSFFDIQKKGFVTYYVMNDLMHDLAEYVSLDECFRIEEGDTQNIPYTVRHLSIQVCCISRLNEMTRYKNLRTLILFGGMPSSFDSTILEDIIKGLRSIRVLDLSPCKLEKFPDGLAKCFHIRYLNLSSTTTVFPEFLYKLYHLQVLNLLGCRFKILPYNINNLVNLRHLIAGHHVIASIEKVGRLKCLQTLPTFKVSKELGCQINQLSDMRELQGTLHIKNIENIENSDEARMAMLDQKEHITGLQLTWESVRSNVDEQRENEVLERLRPHQNLGRLDIVGWMGTKSPSWIGSSTVWLENLEVLYISGCKAWESLPPLGQLPLLKILWLQRMQTVKNVGPEVYGNSTEVFPWLQELVLDEIPELENWSWNKETLRMPNLHSIIVKDCNKLEEIPPLPSLLTELTVARKGFWLPHQHQSKMALSSSSVSSFCIYNCPLLVANFSSPTREEVRESFSSLANLNTDDMSVLKLPLIKERLCTLRNLDIQECSEVSDFSAEEEEHFKMLSSLQGLCISGCANLKSVPVGLHGLESLEKLILWNCPEIYSLPVNGLPQSLRVLEINPCHPLLKDKCRKADGDYWPKIVHVSWIEIDGERVKNI